MIAEVERNEKEGCREERKCRMKRAMKNMNKRE